MGDEEIRPFRVEVPEAVLVDLRERLARTRWPDQIPGHAWDYGTDVDYLRDLCAYWADGFDWRAQEARLNRWPQFLTEIDGQQIHFIHARADNPDALPLIITHGWPGSVAEFLDVIEPLRETFHVVAPSLPGYGWSGPTHESGWDIHRIADAWRTLMARLGYERYGAQGGDWGAIVSARLAVVDAEHVVGLHSNMVVAFPPDPAAIELTELEAADLASMAAFTKSGTAYTEIQGKNPQTLAYGLTDSPAGLAGWIVEKFRDWTDHDGDLEAAVSRDQILTDITVYWVTGTINSSIRLYCESRRSNTAGSAGAFVEVPTAVAVFPKEMLRTPEAYAATRFNVVRYTRFDRGGHFAALEEPDLLVADVREFFGSLR